MNNQKFVESWQNKTDRELEQKEEFEIMVSAREIQESLEAIRALKDNDHYKTFKRHILDKSVQSIQKRIDRNLKDLVHDNNGQVKNSILQDQGMLIAFKKFSNLDELETLYANEFKGLQQRIKSLENKYATKKES